MWLLQNEGKQDPGANINIDPGKINPNAGKENRTDNKHTIHRCRTTPDNETKETQGINTQGVTSLTRKQDTPGKLIKEEPSNNQTTNWLQNTQETGNDTKVQTRHVRLALSFYIGKHFYKM